MSTLCVQYQQQVPVLYTICIATDPIRDWLYGNKRDAYQKQVRAQFRHMITAAQAQNRKTTMFVQGQEIAATMKQHIIDQNQSPGEAIIA